MVEEVVSTFGVAGQGGHPQGHCDCKDFTPDLDLKLPMRPDVIEPPSRGQ
jgi:hypothetical protein